jgi:hypothetical protein
LTRQVLLLPEYHAAYKQLDVWYTCLRDYCKELGIDVEKLEETTTAKEERKNAKEKTSKKVEQAKKTGYSFFGMFSLSLFQFNDRSRGLVRQSFGFIMSVLLRRGV